MKTEIKYLFLLILLLSLSACSAEIGSSSANSISAILAVCGEYILASISLIVLLLIHCIRVVGVAISTMSIYMVFSNLNLAYFDASWLLLIGLLLVLVSFITPIKFHEPKVIIAKNISKIIKQKPENKSQRPLIIDIIVGVIIGVIIIILEQNIDFTFIK